MMDGMSDRDSTLPFEPAQAQVPFPVETEMKPTPVLAWVMLAGLLLVTGALARWVGAREFRKQQGALRGMREAVEQSLAPGEKVVVDDRLLAWALRGGRQGELRESVWAVSEDVPVASLLTQMRAEKRRELVVVATPEDRLIQHLDAAGFSVAQEVGWVPWDVKGNGLALLGRGRMRIYFAVVPLPAESSAKHKGGDVSSEGSGVQR
jgi:hypothetical protein